jgi:hypothetical protein
VEKVGNLKRTFKNRDRADRNQTGAIKLRQIHRRIELCLRQIILRLEIDL